MVQQEQGQFYLHHSEVIVAYCLTSLQPHLNYVKQARSLAAGQDFT